MLFIFKENNDHKCFIIKQHFNYKCYNVMKNTFKYIQVVPSLLKQIHISIIVCHIFFAYFGRSGQTFRKLDSFLYERYQFCLFV